MAGREYLVAHGRAGHVGRFAAGDASFLRGTAVVVRSRRGVELGEVLSELFPERATLPDDFVGQLIRGTTADDLIEADRCSSRSHQLVSDAEIFSQQLGLPIAVLDAEVLLDGRQAVLHAVPYAACDLGPLLERLGESRGLIVRLYDLGADAPPPEDAADHLEEFKCDKPDCGEGDCSSCGTDDGGCSSCSSGGAKQLADYFSGLREEMEKTSRLPLV